MKFCELLAKADKTFRPIVNSLSAEMAVKLYSQGRKLFLKKLSNEILNNRIRIPQEFRQRLWEIDFYSPLFNAAGMFKYGEGYYTVAMQGAGAYLCGTTTAKARIGNIKNKIHHPFISYPKSNSASNWMGLPNYGHSYVAERIELLSKLPGCPIGASISPNPEDEFDSAVGGVIEGLNIYMSANADFAEINESCPNVIHDCDIDSSGLDKNLINRLTAVSEKFLKNRNKNFPIIIKLSNDTNPDLLEPLIDLLLSLGYDGINFGNTSTDYSDIRKQLNKVDLKSFEYFITTFGGGVSGKVLKEKSYTLCQYANEYINKKQIANEFNIIRTGGIENISDINKSKEIGVKLNQWFTGYFDSFSSDGHHLYEKMFK
jgi:dihydroorotate dehydrogenase